MSLLTEPSPIPMTMMLRKLMQQLLQVSNLIPRVKESKSPSTRVMVTSKEVVEVSEVKRIVIVASIGTRTTGEKIEKILITKPKESKTILVNTV